MPPVSREQLASLPPEFRTLLQSVIDHYEAQAAELKARIGELEARLGKTPQNSSLPPFSQHPTPKRSASNPKAR